MSPEGELLFELAKLFWPLLATGVIYKLGYLLSLRIAQRNVIRRICGDITELDFASSTNEITMRVKEIQLRWKFYKDRYFKESTPIGLVDTFLATDAVVQSVEESWKSIQPITWKNIENDPFVVQRSIAQKIRKNAPMTLYSF